MSHLGIYRAFDQLCIRWGLSWWLTWVWQTCQSGLPNSGWHFTYDHQVPQVNSHMEGIYGAKCAGGDSTLVFSLGIPMPSPTRSLYDPHHLGTVTEVPLSRRDWPTHWSLVINWTSELSNRPGSWRVSSADPLTLRHLVTNQGLPHNKLSCDGKRLAINKKNSVLTSFLKSPTVSGVLFLWLKMRTQCEG